MKLTQHNGNKQQHNEINAAQRKQAATQQNVFKQHNGNKPQHNEISAAQRKKAATQWN